MHTVKSGLLDTLKTNLSEIYYMGKIKFFKFIHVLSYMHILYTFN